MVSVGETQYWLTRLCFQRFLGLIYLVAFLVALHQFRPLVGENGLTPATLFLKRVRFWDAPSLFHFYYSDPLAIAVAWAGVLLSVAAISGLSENFGIWVSVGVWALLWFFYLSFVNVGQVWYGFGWESILLETGFLAIFLGSSDIPPSKLLIWLLRWVLFRVMFGAGLIKLRADPCWKDLTCLFYHYETQPLPNPLSWQFHHLPPVIHKGGVLFNHFVELIVPWGLFAPGLVGSLAGFFTILFQSVLILSGNLSWLNYLTIVLCIPCFDDRLLVRFIPIQPLTLEPASMARQGVVIALTIFILILSIKPVLNMISPHQVMNTSFDPFHLVNTYGAFGSVTRDRMEIIIEGTEEAVVTPTTRWREYEFKAKPGNVKRRPPMVAPYHLRLDWLMWFAAMSEVRYHPWVLSLVVKLLKGDKDTLGLLGYHPFPENPPRYIRAELYEYHFTKSRKETGA